LPLGKLESLVSVWPTFGKI